MVYCSTGSVYNISEITILEATMEYREERLDAKALGCREEYSAGFEKVIVKREAKAKTERDKLAGKLFSEPEKMRRQLKDMLGWPLNGEVCFECKTESEKIFDAAEYEIFRMRFEILEGLKLTGLLFKIKTEEKRPLVITQHGGGGTPELASGIYGAPNNYNDMVERTLKYGVHCFAPQLYLWRSDTYGAEHDRYAIDARLKRVGSSLAAVEIYGLQRIIDYFEKQSFVKNFGMIGLSYGGYFTMFTAACDTRIKSAISCSQFSDRSVYAWTDWCWKNSAFTLSDAEIACLVYPRKLCIQVGVHDELFGIEHAKNEYARLLGICKPVGTDWLEFMPFDGKHEFCKDDEPIKKLTDLLKAE